MAVQVGGAQRVGVWAESTLEASVGIVGALAAGATVVPVNPKLGETEMRHVLEDSNPEMLFGAPADALDFDPQRRQPRMSFRPTSYDRSILP